jgi:hypothetical protein
MSKGEQVENTPAMKEVIATVFLYIEKTQCGENVAY